MAETPHKRLRDQESHIEDYSSKRQKPYNTILHLLDEEDPSQEPSRELSRDLSAIYTTLQQELVSSCTTTTTTTTLVHDDDFDSLPPFEASAAVEADGGAGADENDGVKSVMRHLFEASDDELGIPNTMDENVNSEDKLPFSLLNDYNGLWELEDEAANYYTVLQSELFM
ncbi:hypothetical protein MIMGU_mgv1a015074mg [Erythranthe guttata]|uniref:Uncharacterized protein n=1 Tax=Erythranthe guttata TaxID=4155 RepID=A0A022QL93_ERYGU|nr:PREDICTED: uncharacterized protein LOC105967486 [Erythranthe guttata]EYU28731.1 hypothetical protein MIMGU_mgv1a015074mg [Erythranthe guttata]|eukprot:XP_012847539.1 PREDICTED: uncharacterized protein LOC105967486 [Erythranthe guttata]